MHGINSAGKATRRDRVRKMVAGAVAAAAVSAAFVGPAQAADTTTTFSVTSGALSITVPASASLGSGAPGFTASAQLGTVTVNDARAAIGASWTVAVSSSNFTTGTATAAETIDKSAISYWSGLATATSGVATFLPGQLTAVDKVGLGTSKTAFSASATAGNNAASWNPTVIVNIPAQAPAGSYSGTITHSVA